MLEFIVMLSVIALVFCVATVFVALIAGGVLKAGRLFRKEYASDEVK